MNRLDVLDARGRPFRRGGYRRVISLVPSITETLFAMGAGPRVVGRTRWCVSPAIEVGQIPHVGGTKTVDVDAVLALKPDLVIANQEENLRETVDILDRSGPVFVTYPRTVVETLDMCRDLGQLLGAPGGADLARALAADLTWARGARRERPLRALTLIWWNPPMAAGPDTYVSDLLTNTGAGNVITSTGDRYPTLAPDDLTATGPDIVLLPDEPYRFTADLARRIESTVGDCDGRAIPCRVLPGELVTWFGWRTGRALRELVSRISALP